MTVGLLLLRFEIIQSSNVKILGLLLLEQTRDCYLLLVKTLPKKHTLAAPEFSQQKEDCYFNPQEFSLGGRDYLNPLLLPTKKKLIQHLSQRKNTSVKAYKSVHAMIVLLNDKMLYVYKH